MNNAQRWIARTCRGDSLRKIARRTGLSEATLSRRTRADALPIESVVAIAREYEAPILDALVENGFLEGRDIAGDRVERVLRAASDDQLLKEIRRRIGRGQATAS